MTRRIIFLFSVLTTNLFGQKIEVINKSNYTHDYVIGRFQYLENIKDTVRLKYIATLKVNVLNHPGNIISIINLIQIKSKRLGANGFYLDSFSEVDSLISLTIKTYFIYDKYFDINEKNRIKNKAFLFSHIKKENFLQSFYLNDSLVYFNTVKYYCVTPTVGKEYVLKSCNSSGITSSSRQLSGGLSFSFKGAITIKAKADKDANFFGLYRDRLIPKDNLNKEVKSQVFKCGIESLGYDEGRILLEIYQQEN